MSPCLSQNTRIESIKSTIKITINTQPYILLNPSSLPGEYNGQPGTGIRASPPDYSKEMQEVLQATGNCCRTWLKSFTIKQVSLRDTLSNIHSPSNISTPQISQVKAGTNRQQLAETIIKHFRNMPVQEKEVEFIDYVMM